MASWYIENMAMKKVSYAQEFADQAHPAAESGGGSSRLNESGRGPGGATRIASGGGRDWFRVAGAVRGEVSVPVFWSLISHSGSSVGRIGPVSSP